MYSPNLPGTYYIGLYRALEPLGPYIVGTWAVRVRLGFEDALDQGKPTHKTSQAWVSQAFGFRTTKPNRHYFPEAVPYPQMPDWGTCLRTTPKPSLCPLTLHNRGSSIESIGGGIWDHADVLDFSP